MKEETRRLIAFEAASRINGHPPATVFSVARGMHSIMSPGYDHEARARFTTSDTTIFHHGTDSHVDLVVNGQGFKGYDFDEGHHFAGSVDGSTVEVFDYGEDRTYKYYV
jgi:hypothetical protein